MVHSYYDSKLTQPDVDSSNSSDCENSDDRLDTIISTLLGNLTVYKSEDEEEMTIKKYKKDRNKVDRTETEREKNDRIARNPFNHIPSGASASNSSWHLTAPRRSLGTDMQNMLCKNDVRVYNCDSQSSAPKRIRSVFHNESSNNQKLCEKGNRITDSFNETSGNNSEDEYYMATGSRSQVPFQVEESEMSTLLREKKGWKITLVGTDGACLFRAVAHQIFGDEEKHLIIREQVINYMKQNREHFSQFISEDFDHYLLRKIDAHSHGNHVEIQALSELYNRPVEIYHNSLEPINVFHREYVESPPLRLSYHGGVHYNSIVDPQNPTYGEGLGMPNYQPKLSEPELVEKAKNESEKSQIEETILQERLKRSENHAIERSIAEQVAQESYMEYLKYLSSQTRPSDAGSLPESAVCSVLSSKTTRRGQWSPTTSTASCSYSSRSGRGDGSSTTTEDRVLRQVPARLQDMDEDAVLAMVLEDSRREYLASLPVVDVEDDASDGGGGAGHVASGRSH